jgi:tRNA-binding protein
MSLTGAAMEQNQISFEDFQKVDIRVGKIINVEDFPKAKNPAYKLAIDFGKFGVKNSSAHITQKYSKEKLLGKLVIAVTNFPPKQVADLMSEVLVLGVITSEGVVLLNIDEPVALGSKIA